jgi:hypothetical protein
MVVGSVGKVGVGWFGMEEGVMVSTILSTVGQWFTSWVLEILMMMKVRYL